MSRLSSAATNARNAEKLKEKQKLAENINRAAFKALENEVDAPVIAPAPVIENEQIKNKQLQQIPIGQRMKSEYLQKSKNALGFEFPVKIKKGYDKYKKGFFSPKITENNAQSPTIFSEFTSTEKIEKDYYGKVVNFNGTKAIVKTCDKNSSEPYKMVSIKAIDYPLDSQINQYKNECKKLQGLQPQPTIVPVSGGTRHRKRSKCSKRTKKQRKHRK
jgi:hypothetical protein